MGPVTSILKHIYAIWVKEQSEESFPLSVFINRPGTGDRISGSLYRKMNDVFEWGSNAGSVTEGD